MSTVGGSLYPITSDRASLAARFAGGADGTTLEIIDRVKADPALGEHFSDEFSDHAIGVIRASVLLKSRALAEGCTPELESTGQIVAIAIEHEIALDLLQRAYRIAYAVQMEVCVELIGQMPMRERDRRPLMREVLDLLLRAELERTRVLTETYAALAPDRPPD